jgi:hypothetical protein
MTRHARRALQLGAIVAMVCSAVACRGRAGVSAAERRKILTLLAHGALEDAKQALDRLGNTPRADLDDLWSQYYLQIVYRTPVSGASVAAVAAIKPGKSEKVTATDFIHYSIRQSARAASGATVADDRIKLAEDALWRGDNGHALRVMLCQFKGERCLRDQEWPCLAEQVAALQALDERSQAQKLGDEAAADLRRKAMSAEECTHDEPDRCRQKAIDYWLWWEELTGAESPDLRRLRSEHP